MKWRGEFFCDNQIKRNLPLARWEYKISISTPFREIVQRNGEIQEFIFSICKFFLGMANVFILSRGFFIILFPQYLRMWFVEDAHWNYPQESLSRTLKSSLRRCTRFQLKNSNFRSVSNSFTSIIWLVSLLFLLFQSQSHK